jgi:hypothetical protein
VLLQCVLFGTDGIQEVHCAHTAHIIVIVFFVGFQVTFSCEFSRANGALEHVVIGVKRHMFSYLTLVMKSFATEITRWRSFWVHIAFVVFKRFRREQNFITNVALLYIISHMILANVMKQCFQTYIRFATKLAQWPLKGMMLETHMFAEFLSWRKFHSTPADILEVGGVRCAVFVQSPHSIVYSGAVAACVLVWLSSEDSERKCFVVINNSWDKSLASLH